MYFRYEIEKDSIVKEYILERGISRNLGRKIKLYGEIYINGEAAMNYYPLNKGDILDIYLEEKANPLIFPVKKEIEILYEDPYILILNKTANLSTQPSKKHLADNLVGRIKNYYQEREIHSNIHIVTRLDYATSGLVLVAKNGYIHHQLSNIAMKKDYFALIEGVLEKKRGYIDLPIKRLEGDRIKRVAAPDGKRSLTLYQTLSYNSSMSLLKLRIKTGRPHQIRVHLSSLNHPIIGDKLYGKGGDILHLHSHRLSFIHPISKEKIDVESFPIWLE